MSEIRGNCVQYSELRQQLSITSYFLGHKEWGVGNTGIRRLDSGYVTPGKLLSFSGLLFPLLYSNSVVFNCVPQSLSGEGRGLSRAPPVPQPHAPTPNVLFLVCITSVHTRLRSSGGFANHWLVSTTSEVGVSDNLL